MGFLKWLRDKFTFGKNSEMIISTLASKIAYKKLAIDACVNFIAAALSGCEFMTFADGKESRNELYYLLNVRPNVNQSAGEFWAGAISKLLKRNEVLIVQPSDGRLYVADEFTVDENVIYPHRYENVTVGSLVFARGFDEDEVLHIKLHESNIKDVLGSIYSDYDKLIASAITNYKRKNTTRVIVETPAVTALTDDETKAREKLFNKDFRAWFEADGAGAALPLPTNIKLHDWSNSDKIQHVSRDMRALIDDMFDFVTTAYRVPGRLLRGDVAAELHEIVDAFIMFCLKPLAELIADEINAKMYSKAAYLRRSYVKINTLRIKLVDITRFATAAEKLYAASVHSVNDNRRLLEEEPIDEPWANKYAMTKNYQYVDEQPQRGGEDIEVSED